MYYDTRRARTRVAIYNSPTRSNGSWLRSFPISVVPRVGRLRYCWHKMTGRFGRRFVSDKLGPVRGHVPCLPSFQPVLGVDRRVTDVAASKACMVACRRVTAAAGVLSLYQCRTYCFGTVFDERRCQCSIVHTLMLVERLLFIDILYPYWLLLIVIFSLQTHVCCGASLLHWHALLIQLFGSCVRFGNSLWWHSHSSSERKKLVPGLQSGHEL